MNVTRAVKKATILAVDDQLKVTLSIKLILNDYEVMTASSGEEALRLLSKPNVIDLVLLDIKLGGIDGLEVLRKIKRQKNSPGVILVTADGEKEQILEALRHHADDYLQKPFTPHEVQRVIQGYFDREYVDRVADGSEPGPIARAVELLRRNVDRDVTLEDASRTASLSPKYLSRIFKKETGMNFLDYKLGLRNREAGRLLRETRLDISTIASQLGYENPGSFTKAFKKGTGQTPSQFRAVGGTLGARAAKD